MEKKCSTYLIHGILCVLETLKKAVDLFRVKLKWRDKGRGTCPWYARSALLQNEVALADKSKRRYIFRFLVLESFFTR